MNEMDKLKTSLNGLEVSVDRLISQRDALQKKLLDLEGQTNCCMQCEVYVDHLQKMQVTNGDLTQRVDALKKELEDKKGFKGNGYYLGMEETYMKAIDEWRKKADHYKSLAAKLAEALKRIAKKHIDNKADMVNVLASIAKEALKLYDATAEKDGGK